jgi:hypothetical protein
MKAQIYELVNDKLGILDTLLKRVREDKDIINIDYDAHSS